MIKSVKIRLLPSKEQEELMFKSVGVARFSYNWALAEWNSQYERGERPNSLSLKKQFNNTLKKSDDYSWLREVSSQLIAQSFADLGSAFNNFFKGKAKYPRFKSKKKSKQAFYVRHDRLNIVGETVNLEKIGRMTFKTNYRIPKFHKYHNPRCSYDGKYWYLSFGYEQDENQVELNKDLSIGIDLGISNLAIISDLDKPIKNINKSLKVRKLKKKLKRLQRRVSRKYQMNKEGDRFIKTRNIVKLEREIRLIYRKLTNIRNNHIHQATNKVVKLRPFKVVMEDLNISGMMKNKHLADAIAEQKMYEFIRQMNYKCKFNGIEFVQADRFFPSSKKCSSCGNIKSDLRLSDRVYRCDCGFEMDRDKNASLNLSKYEKVS